MTFYQKITRTGKTQLSRLNGYMEVDNCRVLLTACWLCCLSHFLVTPARTQTVITLEQAIKNGLEQSRSIASGVRESGIRALQTKALYRRYMPLVSGEYSYVYNPILPTSILPIGVFNPNFPPDATQNVRFGTSWSQTAGVNADQPLLDFSIKRKIQEARVAEKISRVSNKETAYELVYAILKSYIQVFILESERQEAVADSVRTRVSYDLQQTRYDENRLLKADLNKAKINHNNAVQRVADATSRLEEEKILLWFLMGEKNVDNIDYTIDDGFFTGEAMSWLEKSPVPDQLPALQRLSLQSQRSVSQMSVEKAALLPTVSLKGYIGANQFTNAFNPFAPGSWFGMSFIGVSAAMPILSRESIPNRLHQIQLQAEQYALEKEQIEETIAKDVLTIRSRIESLKNRLQTLDENLALTEEALQIYQERFSEGVETASVVNTEEAWYQLLQSEYNTEKNRMWLLWLDYVNAAGFLSEWIP